MVWGDLRMANGGEWHFENIEKDIPQAFNIQAESRSDAAFCLNECF